MNERLTKQILSIAALACSSRCRPTCSIGCPRCRRRPRAAGTGWLPLSTSSLCAGPCLFVVVVVVIRMRVATSIMVLVTKKRENQRKTHQVDTAHRRLPARLVVVPYVALAARRCCRRPRAAGTGWLLLSTSSSCAGPCLFVVVVIRMRVASLIMVLVTKKRENE